MTYVPAKFDIDTNNGLRGKTLQENTLFDLGIKVTQNVAQHSLHYVTYAPANFEVATLNS